MMLPNSVGSLQLEETVLIMLYRVLMLPLEVLKASRRG
jgi:hypothetical protein